VQRLFNSLSNFVKVDFEILQLREKLYQSQVALLSTVAGNSEATQILTQALEDIMSGFALESRPPPPPPKSNKITLEITDFPTSASPSSTSSPPY